MTAVIDKSNCDPHGYRLTAELLVAEPREQVFAFFAGAQPAWVVRAGVERYPWQGRCWRRIIGAFQNRKKRAVEATLII